MAPDKLYVSQLIYGTWQYQTPDPDDETQVEYIRKDKLIEWAKENQEKCFSVVEDDLWQEVIDKINTL